MKSDATVMLFSGEDGFEIDLHCYSSFESSYCHNKGPISFNDCSPFLLILAATVGNCRLSLTKHKQRSDAEIMPMNHILPDRDVVSVVTVVIVSIVTGVIDLLLPANANYYS